MAYDTQANNNNTSDKPKADAFINIRTLRTPSGGEVPMAVVKPYSTPLYVDKSKLSDALIEQAKKNGGKLTITLVAEINVVSEEADVDFGALGE